MNRGLIPGLNSDGWREYVPELKCGAASGSVTEPSLGTAPIQRGRYLVTRSGFVIVQALIRWGTSPAEGVGNAYMVSLPIAANRWTKSSALPNGADLPIGSGMISQGRTLDPAFNIPVIPTITDPWNVSNVKNDYDKYAQLFSAHMILAAGTATIAASGTSVTVTYSTSAVGPIPRASDIQVVPTGTLSGSNWQIFEVQNITATTFDIVTKASVGTGGQSFGWKVRATPYTSSGTYNVPMLVAPGRPWLWDATHEMTLELFYEAA